MKLDTISEIYQLISQGTKDFPTRKQALFLRKNGIQTIGIGNGFNKLAFDTRRINQETEINPRRGLQNYNRSEAFVNEAMSQKLKNFDKLRKILGSLKEVYGKEPEWQDSNARVLLSTLNKGLRTDQQDGDYTEAQPGTGSLDYIEELLHVRYRLGFDDLTKMAAPDIKRIILSKDEELTKQDIDHNLHISKGDIVKENYDTLLEKLFGGVKATAENREVERTVTITIKDKFVEK